MCGVLKMSFRVARIVSAFYFSWLKDSRGELSNTISTATLATSPYRRRRYPFREGPVCVSLFRRALAQLEDGSS